ncbi:hypothetical protein SprV_0200740800 [Sparganum proliferum]
MRGPHPSFAGQRIAVKTGATIYFIRIAAAKGIIASRKSEAPPTHKVNGRPLSTCLRCKRTFRARIDNDGSLQTHCTSSLTSPNTGSKIVPTPASTTSTTAPALTTDMQHPRAPQSSIATASIIPSITTPQLQLPPQQTPYRHPCARS